MHSKMMKKPQKLQLGDFLIISCPESFEVFAKKPVWFNVSKSAPV